METRESSKVNEVKTAYETTIPEVGDSEQPVKPQHTIAANRQRRQIKSLVRYGYTNIAYALIVGDKMERDELSSYSEVMASSESLQWLGAMSEEMESLHRNQTWELVKVPKSPK